MYYNRRYLQVVSSKHDSFAKKTLLCKTVRFYRAACIACNAVFSYEKAVCPSVCPPGV